MESGMWACLLAGGADGECDCGAGLSAVSTDCGNVETWVAGGLKYPCTEAPCLKKKRDTLIFVQDLLIPRALASSRRLAL